MYPWFFSRMGIPCWEHTSKKLLQSHAENASRCTTETGMAAVVLPKVRIVCPCNSVAHAGNWLHRTGRTWPWRCLTSECVLTNMDNQHTTALRASTCSSCSWRRGAWQPKSSSTSARNRIWFKPNCKPKKLKRNSTEAWQLIAEALVHCIPQQVWETLSIFCLLVAAWVSEKNISSSWPDLVSGKSCQQIVVHLFEMFWTLHTVFSANTSKAVLQNLNSFLRQPVIHGASVCAAPGWQTLCCSWWLFLHLSSAPGAKPTGRSAAWRFHRWKNHVQEVYKPWQGVPTTRPLLMVSRIPFYAASMWEGGSQLIPDAKDACESARRSVAQATTSWSSIVLAIAGCDLQLVSSRSEEQVISLQFVGSQQDVSKCRRKKWKQVDDGTAIV